MADDPAGIEVGEALGDRGVVESVGSRLHAITIAHRHGLGLNAIVKARVRAMRPPFLGAPRTSIQG